MAFTLVATERAGSFASAAEREIISTPPKENMTTAIEIQMEAGPLGRKPPSFTRFAVPAAAWPGRPTNTSSTPITINTMTAETLIEESMNSRAPKDFTLTRFSTRIIAPKRTTNTARGTSGNQYAM